MKNHNNDERVIQIRRKINSYAFSLCYLLLFLSIIIKQFILELEFSSYISELLIFLLSSLFIVIYSVKAGIYSSNVNKDSKSRMFLYSILNIVVIFSLITLFTTIKDGFDLSITVSYLIPITIISFTIMFVIFSLLDKVTNKINKNELK